MSVEGGELDPTLEKERVAQGHITPRYVVYRPFTRHDSIGAESTDSNLMKASLPSQGANVPLRQRVHCVALPC